MAPDKPELHNGNFVTKLVLIVKIQFKKKEYNISHLCQVNMVNKQWKFWKLNATVEYHACNTKEFKIWRSLICFEKIFVHIYDCSASFPVFLTTLRDLNMTTPSKEGNDPCSNENSEESESDADMDEVLLAEFEDNDPGPTKGSTLLLEIGNFSVTKFICLIVVLILAKLLIIVSHRLSVYMAGWVIAKLAITWWHGYVGACLFNNFF